MIHQIIKLFGGTFVKKKIFTSFLSVTVLSTSLLGTVSVSADDFDTQIEQAQQEAAQNESAANNLDAIINQLTNDVANTQEALNQLTNTIEKNERQLAESMKNLEIANAEMHQLLQEIEVLKETIDRREEKLEEQARQIQVNGNSSTYLEYILDSESLTDILARVDLVTNIIDTSNKLMEDQIKDKEAVEEKSVKTEQKIAQQNAIAAELEQTSVALEEQKASEEALMVQLQIEQNSVASDREALMAQRDEALQRVSEIQNNQAIAQAAAAEAAAERARAEAVAKVEAERVASETERVSVSTSRQESLTVETTQPREEAPLTNSTNNNEGSNQSENTGSNQQTPPVSKPEPKPEPTPPASSGDLLSVARSWLGTEYLFGGNSDDGIDCSAFVQNVFAAVGKSIPRTSSSQFANSQRISNPQVGDLIFFSNYGTVVDHVGIYLGGGQFIGSQSNTGVAYSQINSGYWSTRVVGYGRY